MCSIEYFLSNFDAFDQQISTCVLARGRVCSASKSKFFCIVAHHSFWARRKQSGVILCDALQQNTYSDRLSCASIRIEQLLCLFFFCAFVALFVSSQLLPCFLVILVGFDCRIAWLYGWKKIGNYQKKYKAKFSLNMFRYSRVSILTLGRWWCKPSSCFSAI